MRMDASLIPQNNHGTMVEDVELESMSSSSENSSVSSDSLDDATSSTSSSSLSNKKDDRFEDGPLHEMSCLIAQLPFKRGLSKFYNGKSQSFTSLSNVRGLEELAKPERLYRKNVYSSKSYKGGLGGRQSLSPNWCSKTITKKVSRGPPLSPSARSRPPIPPRKSSNFFWPYCLLEGVSSNGWRFHTFGFSF